MIYSFLPKTIFRIVCLGILILITGIPVFGQDGYVTQRVVPVVQVNSQEFIQSLLEEQFILPEETEIEYAVLYDITRDGFGSNDALVLYPSQEQFQLGAYLSSSIADALRTQGLATDYNLVTIREYAELLTEEAENEMDPKKALASTMIRTIESYYSDGDFQGYISRKDQDVQISFWGYDESKWEFIPGVSQCLEPPTWQQSVTIIAHKQPEIRSFLDIDGCVIVESSSSSAEISSRVCD
ncbi:MAG: hypothetical protein OXF08_06525 [Bacteroidetes bacterium]|nr:hypothetical protein [Bacteroidota bacterium]